MCGIVLAVISETALASDLLHARRDVHRSMIAMDARGGHSWGIGYTDTPDTLDVRHGIGAYATGERCLVPRLSAGGLAVGHTRFATRGSVTLQNAHPFRHGAGAWAHNGTYAFPRGKEGPHETVDSYYLTAQIAGAADEWKDRALSHEGYGTVVGIDASTMAAYIWQSGGSHVVYRMAWGILIASTSVEPGDRFGVRLASIPHEVLHLVSPRECASTGVEVSLADERPSWSRWTRHAAPQSLADLEIEVSTLEWQACIGCGETYQGAGYMCPDCEGEP